MKQLAAIAICAVVIYADAREWPPSVCIGLCGLAALVLAV